MNRQLRAMAKKDMYLFNSRARFGWRCLVFYLLEHRKDGSKVRVGSGRLRGCQNMGLRPAFNAANRL